MTTDFLVSDRFPRRPLSASIALARRLVGAWRGEADVKTVISQLGYRSVSGAAKTALAAMQQYGLIEKPHGQDKVTVTEALIQLDTDGAEAEKIRVCRDLAMRPPLFQVMRREGLNFEDEPLLLRWLLLRQLSRAAAQSAARIYRDNAKFVQLGKPDSEGFQLPLSAQINPGNDLVLSPESLVPPTEEQEFKFALITCDARLVFTKPGVQPVDLDRLREYLDLLEKSWRARKITAPNPQAVG
jgi:hypothetical protein